MDHPTKFLAVYLWERRPDCGSPHKVSGCVLLGKHPRLFWYKLLEGTAPNAVYNQGNGYDILNDERLWFLLNIDPRNFCMHLLPWAGISAPLIVPTAVSPLALLLFDKEVNSELEGEIFWRGGGVGQAHVGFGWQCWAHVPAVALPASGTSLFISIQCQSEL